MVAAVLLAILLGSNITVAPTKNANGTTLPFQRQVLRVDPGNGGALLIAAIQKQGAEDEGLVLYSSADGGRSWRRELAVQNDISKRDTADLIADEDGRGFSLIYGLEPHSSRFAPDERSDVVYLHYRVDKKGRLHLDGGPVVVFRPAAGQGYFRPSITRDARGVLHATATLLDRGEFILLASRSTDGMTWSPPQQLAAFGDSFGGGRVIGFGQRVMVIFDAYSRGQPARYRTRAAGMVGEWAPELVLATDGIYHAGAFSVVVTPDGTVHLGYADKAASRLKYRHFDGARWSDPLLIEPIGWWANQPALGRTGNDVHLAWNRKMGEKSMRMMVRTLRAGTWGPEQVLDDGHHFKGYTSAPERALPGGVWPVLWSQEGGDAGPICLVRCALKAP